MQDSRGVEVTVGASVVYGTRVSSSLTMHVGTVTEIIGNTAIVRVPLQRWEKRWTRRVTGVNMVVVDGIPVKE